MRGRSRRSGDEDNTTFSLWAEAGEDTFAPSLKPHGPKLDPGTYKAWVTPGGGIRFTRLSTRESPLMRFPGVVDKIIEEIRFFWDRREVYHELRLPHRRGILLFGPPGTGKTSLVRLALDEAVARDGLGLMFSHFSSLKHCYSVLRQIEPEVPVVVAIEDLDGLVGRGGVESDLLDFMDGHQEGVTNTVFVATTNYINKIPDRIKNRPSRFDKKFEIGFPESRVREVYFESLLKSVPSGLDTFEGRFRGRDVVKDTKNMSLAHMKELFIAVTVLGCDYKESLDALRSAGIFSGA